MENHFNCIYCYMNKVNGKKYVGQAVDFIKRYKQHFYNAHNPKSNEYDFYFSRSIRKRTNHDFKKYEEIYSVEILKEDLSTQEELNYWEDYYILEFDLLHKNGKGYNCKLNGINGQIGNTLAGKTEEELAEISRKHSEIMSETWKNKSDEEMKEISRKRSEINKEIWKNKSDEEKAERSRKWKETWKNKSDEEMKEIRRKQSEAHKETWKNKSDEEKAERSRKISESMKETWKNKSDEERAERSRKHSETWKNKSDEELAEINRKHSEARKNKSEEELVEFSRKMSEIWKNRTDEELAEIRRKQSETMNNKSEEEKAETRRKQSETRKGKFTGKNNPSARKIVSVDPSAKQPVFIWQYKQQATEFYGIGKETLNYYLKGKAKKGHEYNGFLWYYLDEWQQLTK